MNRVFVVALTDSVHHQFSNNSHLPSSLQNRIFQVTVFSKCIPIFQGKLPTTNNTKDYFVSQ